MKATRVVVVGAVALALLVIGVLMVVRRRDDAGTCSEGFHRVGSRCCATSGAPPAGGVCPRAVDVPCPAPLVATPAGCDAPSDARVTIPATSVQIGPSDWEAEGRVQPRILAARSFQIDRFEISVGRAFCASCPLPRAETFGRVDAARAAADVTFDEAASICHARGGRLPSEDEWMVAAAGSAPRRYPWGDTGAVCRRAAWGLAAGPCGTGASGPDTVGAHPDGRTPSGVDDLAGNVAEWVSAGDGCTGGACANAVVHGGAWDTALATDLRTWRRTVLPRGTRAPTIGFRCAYDVAVP